jgi:hypothetical protein
MAAHKRSKKVVVGYRSRSSSSSLIMMRRPLRVFTTQGPYQPSGVLSEIAIRGHRTGKRVAAGGCWTIRVGSISPCGLDRFDRIGGVDWSAVCG